MRRGDFNQQTAETWIGPRRIFTKPVVFPILRAVSAQNFSPRGAMPDYTEYIMALVHCYPGRDFSLEELSRETAIPLRTALRAADQLVAAGQLARKETSYLLNRRRSGTRIPPLLDRRAST